MKPQAGPVKALAFARGIPVRQPATLNSERERAPIVAVRLDVLVVAAYGLIVPAAMLSWPLHGCINIHASLLPRWRGAAPIARAILAGDTETGISIMRMDEGLDTGPVLSQHALAVDPRETAGSLHDKLAALGARAIVETLAKLRRGETIASIAQEAHRATYASKVGREEATIDWRDDAVMLDRRVRAFDPWPGAQTTLDGVPLKVWKAFPLRGRFGPAGSVVRADHSGIVVACGDGALAVAELQRASGRRMSAEAFIAGHPLEAGARLGAG
jgi:methionyl-tRNA formyltransferase